jgi:cysteine-S-conjugate beta-lyase
MARGKPPESWRPETRLLAAGRDPARQDGAVNPPVHHASTIILDTAAALYAPGGFTYARDGMAVHQALAAAMTELEGGAGATLTPSGLSACTLALLAATRAGGDVLLTDSVYGPTRRFAEKVLKRFGVSVRYYAPRIGAAIAELIRPETTAIVLESPGSLTFEIQDIPAIVAAARARGVATMIDNTWAAGLYFKPLALGVDLSLQALTKYPSGHADVLAGAVIARDEAWATAMYETGKNFGIASGPDDAYLALRGLRTLPMRMAAQAEAGRKIADWLAAQPEVVQVLHPGRPDHPDHALWARDFTGAAGLFGVVLKPLPEARLHAMLESLRLFAMGFSWGGFESLILPCDPQILRTVAPWRAEGPLLRLSIGLEHVDDLIADLDAGFAHLR